MITIVDTFLNQTTMYRLMVYYLGGLVLVATAESVLGTLPYSAFDVLISTTFLVAACWVANTLFAYVWEVPTNTESSLITALILALIITPASPLSHFWLLTWAAVLAMASKYMLAIRHRHLFNPVGAAVALTSIVLGQSASWWVAGNLNLLPFVLAGGLLVIRKVHRTDLVLSFILAAIASTVLFSSSDIYTAVSRTLLHTSVLFFAFVMITEPLTTPPRRTLRIVYGVVVGFLFAPWMHIGSMYSTPELALVIGNLFSFAVSPRFKARITLREIKKLANDTYEFIFESPPIFFRPGQYAEFTVPTDASDTRGNRRYFTIASSPTENQLSIGVKFYPEASTFKKSFAQMRPGDTLLAGSVAGDFILPIHTKTKLVYIAGGIGITPFRSMVKQQLDRKETRDAVLFYSNKTESEIAYRPLFDEAQQAGVGFRTVYTLTDKNTPSHWQGERGYVDAAMIAKYAPDYRTRTFYISGPRSMVDTFQKTLRTMGVARHRIKTDFFPGFA